MKIVKNRWFLVGSALIIGLIIGGGVTYYACTAFYADHVSALKTALITVIKDYLFQEEQEALIRFQEGSPVIGVYAQDRLIKHVNRIRESSLRIGQPNFMEEGQHAMLIVTLETRKGILYEDMGEREKASECFNNAARKIKESNMKVSVEAFKSAFKKFRKETK